VNPGRFAGAAKRRQPSDAMLKRKAKYRVGFAFEHRSTLELACNRPNAGWAAKRPPSVRSVPFRVFRV